MSSQVNTSSHGPVYIYSGAGSWGVSVDQTKEMLETAVDSRAIQLVDSLDSVNQETRLVVIPGGEATIISLKLGDTTKKIVNYVANGGRYLGICAGAISVTQFCIQKPSIVDIPENQIVTALQQKGMVYEREIDLAEIGVSTLYPGKCIAPHIVRNQDAAHSDNLCAVDVTMTDKDDLITFKAAHYSGPTFVALPKHTKVLLRYKDSMTLHKVDKKFDRNLRKVKYSLTEEKISEEKPVAALSYPYQSGKIVLSGIHPEINPTSFEEVAKKHTFNGALPKGLETSETGRQTFVSTMFKELGLLQNSSI